MSHDAERELPVHFQWQILDWAVRADLLGSMRLRLQPPGLVTTEVVHQPTAGLAQGEPPPERTTWSSHEYFSGTKTDWLLNERLQ